MKKIAIIAIVLVLIAVGGGVIMYITRDWTEIQTSSCYYYLDEDKEADESSALKEWENTHGKIQESEQDSFPPSFEEYGDRCSAAQIDRSYLKDYSSWKLQCNNMLISGIVSIYLCDKAGNIVYKNEKVTRETGSFEETISDDMMQKIFFLMVLQEDDETEGKLDVILLGK